MKPVLTIAVLRGMDVAVNLALASGEYKYGNARYRSDVRRARQFVTRMLEHRENPKREVKQGVPVNFCLPDNPSPVLPGGVE